MGLRPTPPAPLLALGALINAVLPPAILWGVMVILATAGGYPGAACLTPLAWLLALWVGMRYASSPKPRPDRWPALGPALAGILLGLWLGALFLLANGRMLAGEADPLEIRRGWTFAALLAGASILGCGVLSIFGAVLIFRRSNL